MRAPGSPLVPLLLGALSGLSNAQERPETEERRHELPDAGAARLQGLPGFLGRAELFGLSAQRSWLEARGVSLAALWTFDLSWALGAPEGEEEDAFRNLLDVDVVVDLERSAGLAGSLVVGYQHIGGHEGGELVGDLQGFSNIDAEHRSQIARFAWELVLRPGLELRLGKMDANQRFDAVESGTRFLASAAGYSPTLLGFPTFPDPSFGAELLLGGTGPLELGLGVFDGSGALGVRTGERGPGTLFGAPSALVTLVELGARVDPEDPVAARVALGGWHHSAELERFDGGTDSGTSGAYGLAETRVWGDAARGLALFVQLGWADPALSTFETHLGAGAVWDAPWPERPADHVGLYLSRVGLSDDPDAPFVESHETAIELLYSIAATPWLRLKPDLQYIRHPGGDGSEDAWVATVRCTLRL